jgi:hypothetical protein
MKGERSVFKKLIKIFNFGFVIGIGFLLICPSANSADFPKKRLRSLPVPLPVAEKIPKPMGLLPILKNIWE